MKHRLSPQGIFSISCISIFIAMALLAPMIAPYDPNAVDKLSILMPMSASHLLGTDALGRDVFSRIVYGAQISVFFSIVGAFVTMLLGTVLGVLSGYFGGVADRIISYFIHLFQGVPGMSLMVAIAGIMGPGLVSLLVAITLTSWTSFARLVRGEVYKIRFEGYMDGVRTLGASHPYIIFKYIIPNILPSLIVLLTVRVGGVLLSVATLSFLGLGIQPPQADWGGMIHDARIYFRSYPWLILSPGSCLALLSISIQLLGDEIRDLLDLQYGLKGDGEVSYD